MQIKKDSTKTLLLTHFVIRTNQGPAAPGILKYLLKRTDTVVYIEHPFPHAQIQYSFLSIFKRGTLVYQKKVANIKGPDWLQFIYHFLLSSYFIVRSFSRFDICIACENLSLISTLIFRKIGLINNLVYYSIDYTNKRFNNRIMNNLYYLIDKASCRYSDINWVVTKEQINARKANYGPLNQFSQFSIVPIGYDRSEIKPMPIDRINYFRIIFTGGLLEWAGLQLVIKSIPKLITKFSKIKLTIIGSGYYEKELKRLIKELNISNHVEFLGFIEDYYKLINIVARSSIGLAPYAPLKESVSYKSDPSKIKLYLICGLPVITTIVTTIASQISKTKSGIVIDYSEIDFVKAVEKILNSKKNYLKYKTNAIKLSKKYDLNFILDKAFKEI